MLWMPSISKIQKILLIVLLSSVKGPKDDEWMIDPVVIADSYGPEVCLRSSKLDFADYLRLILFVNHKTVAHRTEL